MDTRSETVMMYDAQKKSLIVAYLLWWFLGFFGVHRFYLGAVLSGGIMLSVALASMCLTLLVVGWIGIAGVGLWWLIDALLIPGIAKDYNLRLIQSLR